LLPKTHMTAYPKSEFTARIENG